MKKVNNSILKRKVWLIGFKFRSFFDPSIWTPKWLLRFLIIWVRNSMKLNTKDIIFYNECNNWLGINEDF